MLRRPAVSAAANRWQLGLLGALRAAGEPVSIASYAPEPAWPRGTLAALGSTALPMGGPDDVAIDYVNLPFVRDLFLCAAHVGWLERTAARRGAPEHLLTYNAPLAYRGLGLEAQRRHGVRWVPVIADLPKAEQRSRHDADLARAAGRIYLSYGSFVASPHEPKLHLDGGVTRLPPPERSPASTRALLFTGALNRWGGVDQLVEAFAHLHDASAALWICGKGANDRLKRAVAADRRITLFGAVDEDKLRALSDAASAFVNPRPPSIPENAHNFPSKVLEYLSYGKPVVSTWTPGLAPEYRDVLMVVEDDSPGALAARLADALALPPRTLDEHRERVRAFLATKKLWSVQAGRLASWLAGLGSRQ
jgi:glycosyltransferase involved in cell wall biosynthesis